MIALPEGATQSARKFDRAQRVEPSDHDSLIGSDVIFVRAVPALPVTAVTPTEMVPARKYDLTFVERVIDAVNEGWLHRRENPCRAFQCNTMRILFARDEAGYRR
jgi:hypothetical protein